MLKNSQVISTEAEWLEARTECITATEMAALFGLNPYSSPRKVLEEKKKSTFIPNAFSIMGQWLEDTVVKASNLALGTLFSTPEGEGKVFCKHPLLALGATPDAWDETDLLECKSTRPETFLKYKEQPPRYYLIQLAVQLMCTERDTGYLSIMMTDLTQISPSIVNPVVIYKMTRSDKLELLIEEEVTRFWGCVTKGKDYRVDSGIKVKVINILEDCVEKIYSVTDQSLELYFKNRVKTYSGIIDTTFNHTGNKSLEDLLNGQD